MAKAENKKKNKHKMNIPYGWTLLKYDENHKMQHIQNFSDSHLRNIERNHQKYVSKMCYLKLVSNMVRYRKAELEENNEPVYLDQILDEIGFFKPQPNDEDDSAAISNMSSSDKGYQSKIQDQYDSDYFSD